MQRSLPAHFACQAHQRLCTTKWACDSATSPRRPHIDLRPMHFQKNTCKFSFRKNKTNSTCLCSACPKREWASLSKHVTASVTYWLAHSHTYSFKDITMFGYYESTHFSALRVISMQNKRCFRPRVCTVGHTGPDTTLANEMIFLWIMPLVHRSICGPCSQVTTCIYEQ